MIEIDRSNYNTLPEQVLCNQKNIEKIAENLKNIVINYKGEYSATANYIPGDGVTYGEALYLCILACVGVSPSNNNYWQLIGSSNIQVTKCTLTTSTTDVSIGSYSCIYVTALRAIFVTANVTVGSPAQPVLTVNGAPPGTIISQSFGITVGQNAANQKRMAYYNFQVIPSPSTKHSIVMSNSLTVASSVSPGVYTLTAFGLIM